jgi:NTP pyrophosphatase (non-canonical NTP hydrolase)
MQRSDSNNSQGLSLAPGEELWPETVTIGNTDWATDDLAGALDAIADKSYATALAKGEFNEPAYEGPLGEAAYLSLVHCEVSEAVEALRKGNVNSVKIPGHSSVEEECADIILRTLNFCRHYGYDVSAVLSKAFYNDGRKSVAERGNRF